MSGARLAIHGLLVSLAVLTAAGASAEEAPTPIHDGIVTSTGSHGPPDPGPFLRPLDDTDPEMKQLVESYFARTPCGVPPISTCEEALQILVGGGNRLARYLIRQIEANDAEGFPNRGTYLRLLGETESREAFDYLQRLLRARAAASGEDAASHQEYLTALEAFGRTRRLDVLPEVLPLLERSNDPDVLIRVVNGADRVQTRHGRLPEVTEALTALRRRLDSHEPDGGLAMLGSPMREVERRVDRVLAEPGQTR